MQNIILFSKLGIEKKIGQNSDSRRKNKQKFLKRIVQEKILSKKKFITEKQI